MKLGPRIDAWCEATGKSYDDLAKAADVTVAAVYQWVGTGESQTTPRQMHLEAVVKCFGVTMAQFYGPIPRKAS